MCRFEEDQMNRIAKKRMKKSGRGTSASLDRVTDFSGLETLLDEVRWMTLKQYLTWTVECL